MIWVDLGLQDLSHDPSYIPERLWNTDGVCLLCGALAQLVSVLDRNSCNLGQVPRDLEHIF